MKKLLATTALVSMIAAPVLAETKIAGSIETTFGDKEAPATGAKVPAGAALGHETKFEFNSSKELNNGWTTALDMEIMEVAGEVADTQITISNGEGLSFYIAKDGDSFHDWNVVPGAYNARPYDNVSNSGGALEAGTIHGYHNLGVGYKSDFGTVGLRYAPDQTTSSTAGDKNSGAGGGSGMEYGFLGSLGVDGLSVGISRAEITPEVDNGNDKLTATHYGVAYNFGKYAIGAERTTVEDKNNADASTTTSSNDTTHTLLGVSFAATDNVTLGLNIMEVDEDTKAAKEEATQFEIAYNLGGATLAFAMEQLENDGGTSGKDADAWTVTYKQSF